MEQNTEIMSSSDIFWGIGDLLTALLTPLDADWGLTSIMNTGVLLLGFVGLFYWLSRQAKYNKQAEANKDQLK